MSEYFDKLHEINDRINSGRINEARNEIIKILDEIKKFDKPFPTPLNHFIREVGLYPYIQLEHASWQERFLYESFKVNVGDENLTLHKEQSGLLRKLIDGKDVAVSAPTSFGKSFVIDSFIAIKNPKNIVIIVPTIALTDETRRRLQRKFSHEYKIITTTDVPLSEKNIFIFPQERASGYVKLIESLDILIIDEFYKASKKFDKERSPSLLRAIIKLSKIAKQRYFLAPNIKNLNESIFTDGMEFINLDFNTVFLEKNNVYEKINSESYTKSDALLEILKSKHGKTLIYAGTYSSINEISTLILDTVEPIASGILIDFSNWLARNYSRNWVLTNLVKRGFGVHNGQLHRSLSQIQVNLFEEDNGLNRLISTSSIIEGVNTSAENVILWQNKNGQAKLNDFTYRNIIGRGGRMFRHFVGNIYLLDKPPVEEESQLTLEFDAELSSSVDEDTISRQLTQEQIAKIIAYRDEMSEILGVESFNRLQQENAFSDSDTSVVLKISRAISESPQEYSGLGYLNSENCNDWEYSLYKILNIIPGYIGAKYGDVVNFIKVISKNWNSSFHELLDELDTFNIGIDQFFDLERKVTFKLTSLLNEVNALQKEISPERKVDISPFIVRASHAFLPKNVYILEEYGLPRMISKKLHLSGILDFENEELPIHEVLALLNDIGHEKLSICTNDLDAFDKYILKYFLDGIAPRKKFD